MRSLVALFLLCSAITAQNAQKQIQLADTDAPLTPVDSPGGGTYSSTQSVTITDATATFILYTLDGSTPACPGTGTLYTGAFNISATTTLKAIGCNGITGGAVLTSVYTISGGGIVIVESLSSAVSTGNSITINLGTATTAGELIEAKVFGAIGASGSCTAPAVTDSGSESYVNIWEVSVSGNLCAQEWYICNSLSGITSITATFLTGTNASGLIVRHVQGITASNCLDQYSAPTSTSSATPWSSGAITTTNASDLLTGTAWIQIATYIGGAQNSALATGSWTQGPTMCAGSSSSPCISFSGNLDNNNGGIFMDEYQIVSSTGSYSATGTNNGSTNTYNNYPAVVSFKGAP